MKVRARLVLAVYVLCAAGILMLGGCLKRKLKPLNPCLVSGVVAEIAVTNIDKVDLLFMVDNSGSMKQEQESLQMQFPRLIEILASGDRDLDGMNDFPPAKDLHLGVVSSDLGLVGIQDIEKCNGLGDDGVLQHEPSPVVTGCQATYPPFLTYTAGVNQPSETANDFACIAVLGTDGCGFEQQLESVLKALWPATDPMPGPDGRNRITFLGDVNMFGQQGHGDNDNAGFIRNNPAEGLSLIAIIMVSDEEDCSSRDTSHFTPAHFLQPNDPLATQALNLRCFYNKQNLYPLQRYIDGYKALRPGNENLVIFGAIVGIPDDLVETADYEAVNWEVDAERNAFYDRILADPRMREVEDPTRTPEQGGNLTPSCNTPRGVAYPPVRIVEVARGFGQNGTVHSICQADLTGAIDSIIEIIAKQLGAVCLPRPLVRNAEGTVGCNVVWELPPPGQNSPMTPTDCQPPNYPFLLPPDSGRSAVTQRGGKVCKVAQLRVESQQFQPTTDDESGQTFSEGWYYDDFSEAVQKECTGSTKQRVAFTPAAKPPTGVTVKLECLNETQSLAKNRTDVASGDQPTIGDPCEMVMRNSQTLRGDEACIVRLASPTDRYPDGQDTSMFCHPEDNVCVLQCETRTDCPAAWVCDDRAETMASTGDRKICVNPTCGDRNK